MQLVLDCVTDWIINQLRGLEKACLPVYAFANADRMSERGHLQKKDDNRSR